MSKENSNNNQRNDKHRLPDAYMSIRQKNSNGTSKLVEVGALWNAKEGYQTGDSVYGPIVIQSREAREALKEMRSEREQTQTQEQAHSQSQEH